MIFDFGLFSMDGYFKAYQFPFIVIKDVSSKIDERYSDSEAQLSIQPSIHSWHVTKVVQLNRITLDTRPERASLTLE